MFLNAHTHHLSDQTDVLELYNQFPNELNNEAKLFSVGIHPAYINTSSIEEEIEIINQILTFTLFWNQTFPFSFRWNIQLCNAKFHFHFHYNNDEEEKNSEVFFLVYLCFHTHTHKKTVIDDDDDGNEVFSPVLSSIMADDRKSSHHNRI